MAIYCPRCGGYSHVNTGICSYCGVPLPAQPNGNTAPVQPQYQQPVYQQPVYQQPPMYQQPVYQQPPYYGQPYAHLPVKSKMVAALLAFFLGGIGIHKFYLGRTGAGIAMLLFCWTGIPSFIALIDFIVLLCSSDQTLMQKYNCRFE